MTVAEMIKAAARAKGAIDRYNDLEPEEYKEGLTALNAMLALWATEGINLCGQVTDVLPLIPGKAVYSIGAAADLATVRPVEITTAILTLADGITDRPVVVIGPEEYDRIPIKNTGGSPNCLAYQPTAPNGILVVYPVPTVAETLTIKSMKSLGSFASLEDDITLAPETEEAVKYNLSLRVVPEVPPTAIFIQLAKDGKNGITRMPPVAPVQFEPGVLHGGGAFNINEG